MLSKVLPKRFLIARPFTLSHALLLLLAISNDKLIETLVLRNESLVIRTVARAAVTEVGLDTVISLRQLRHIFAA